MTHQRRVIDQTASPQGFCEIEPIDRKHRNRMRSAARLVLIEASGDMATAGENAGASRVRADCGRIG
jgi:hypothetical protein